MWMNLVGRQRLIPKNYKHERERERWRERERETLRLLKRDCEREGVRERETTSARDEEWYRGGEQGYAKESWRHGGARGKEWLRWRRYEIKVGKGICHVNTILVLGVLVLWKHPIYAKPYTILFLSKGWNTCKFHR